LAEAIIADGVEPGADGGLRAALDVGKSSGGSGGGART